MSVLNDLSNDFANNIQTLNPSIVRVEARRRLSATGIVWSADGVIVTANHVVTHDEGIKVVTHDGTSHDATLVGRDPSTDIAVLRVNATLTAPKWSNMEAVKVGHLVLALGRPGNSVQATLGVVSAVGGAWRTHMGGKLSHYLQTDVVMYPGFSGGPLVDSAGAIIGLNTSGLLRGASVAVPNTTLQSVVGDLLKHGRVRRGYLGVAMQAVRLPDTLAEQIEQETGLLIISVEKDSPAEKAGLVLGDTIVGFDGESVRHMDHLLTLLTGDSVGKTVPMAIVRSGALHTVNVTIGEHE